MSVVEYKQEDQAAQPPPKEDIQPMDKQASNNCPDIHKDDSKAGNKNGDKQDKNACGQNLHKFRYSGQNTRNGHMTRTSWLHQYPERNWVGLNNDGVTNSCDTHAYVRYGYGYGYGYGSMQHHSLSFRLKPETDKAN